MMDREKYKKMDTISKLEHVCKYSSELDEIGYINCIHWFPKPYASAFCEIGLSKCFRSTIPVLSHSASPVVGASKSEQSERGESPYLATRRMLEDRGWLIGK